MEKHEYTAHIAVSDTENNVRLNLLLANKGISYFVLNGNDRLWYAAYCTAEDVKDLASHGFHFEWSEMDLKTD